MTLEEFIAGIPAALTLEAVSRAVEAASRRDDSVTSVMTGEQRDVWTVARGQAKAVAKGAVNLATPGVARDAAWAAIGVAMDAAGAVALQPHISSDNFSRLYAPWEFMTTPTEVEEEMTWPTYQ